MDILQKIKQFFLKKGVGKVGELNIIQDILKRNSIETTFNMDKYFNNVEKWKNIYKGVPAWKDEQTKLLNIASMICTELAQTTMIELNINVNSSDEEKKLKIEEIYYNLIDNLPESLELTCALGGIIFKPIIENNDIIIDVIKPTNFIPIQFNSKNELIGVIFFEQIEIKDNYYIRTEKHELTENGYIITNKLYKSNEQNTLGKEIPLSDLERYKNLNSQELYTNLNTPLFVYLKTPIANNTELNNPLGISHFHRAIDLLKDSDLQYSRLLWEFEGGELAVHVEESFLFSQEKDLSNFNIAKLNNRLYRKLNTDTNISNFLEVFSPQLRDVSLINGLNEVLKQIENTCGFVHGTFSNPDTDSKTATEIKLSKQRNYITITAYQNKVKKALNDLLYIFEYLLQYTKQFINIGDITLIVDFDDSVLTDTEEEFKRRLTLHSKNIISDAELRAWYFGETIEDAQSKLPPKILDFETE